ncbi:MAG TPA: fused MFS/spermidine synthase [Steroidobacteraceae bacterium]|nr:fused MFS/spermidine synthase [Steroidobacteraceae bacterium]
MKRLLALCLLTALASRSALAAGQLIHSERSLYRQVLVYEEAGTRCLCFTRQCAIGRQSCVVLANPRQLVFEYTRMMLGALFLRPDPHRVLIIGLGGGTLPRTLAGLLPDATIDAVEIDPAVVRVAKDYFGFVSGPHINVFEEDGRAYVRRVQRAGTHYDLVLLDAYDSEYIPEHLLTREFLQEVQALLAPGAVLAANTFSASRLYNNESVTYHAVFGDFYNLRSGNRVILLRQGGLPPMAEVSANSRRFDAAFAPLGFKPEALLPLFSSRADWDPDARLLTDQYSPANLLNR